MRASNVATNGFVSKQTNSLPTVVAVEGAEESAASFLILVSIVVVMAIVVMLNSLAMILIIPKKKRKQKRQGSNGVHTDTIFLALVLSASR